jgi:spermidine synthase
MGFLLFNPEPENIGMIGLGGGSLPKYCFVHLPNSSITVAENSPDVIALSEYFHIPENGPRFHVVCADGVDFVKDKSAHYDVLIVDGFNSHGQPEQLCTQEFYDDCYQSLSPNGILVVNLLAPDYRNDDRIQRISQSFEKDVITLNALDSFNKIVFAFKGTASLLPDHVLVSRLGSLEMDHSINLSITIRSLLLQRRLRKIMPFLGNDIRQFTQ